MKAWRSEGRTAAFFSGTAGRFTLILALTAPLLFSAAPDRRAPLEKNGAALLEGGKDMFLEVTAAQGDSAASLARKYTGSDRNKSSLRHEGRTLKAGRKAYIPFALLLPEYQRAAVKALFPDDRCDPASGDWIHAASRQPFSQSGETLWRIAEWFTGDGRNHTALILSGGAKQISPGMAVRVPARLLLPSLRCGASQTPAAPPSYVPPPPAAPPPAQGMPERRPVLGPGHPELGYGLDAEGEFALYRLKAGEALYSAVVVRFTGLLTAEEVNATAMDVARRSGIADVTAIPTGYGIKIPLELLMPQYLPEGHPRRADYEALQRDMQRYQVEVSAPNLEGVVMILDAGHGGMDVGASHNGTHERDYVYDVMCRIHRLLSTKTRATVLTVNRNAEFGLAPRDQRDLPPSTRTEILTTPRYRYLDSAERAMNVNLRWYVANRHYQQMRGGRLSAEKFVFLSIHADALHPSVQGSMAYVPGARLVPGSAGGHGGAYQRYEEVRRHGVMNFSSSDRLRSQAYSTQLAHAMMGEFRRAGIRVHPDNPVRDSIVRAKGSPWVPAVLRYNAVPTKILLETVNLANRDDAARLRDPAFREKMAAAVVRALDAHYSRNPKR